MPSHTRGAISTSAMLQVGEGSFYVVREYSESMRTPPFISEMMKSGPKMMKSGPSTSTFNQDDEKRNPSILDRDDEKRTQDPSIPHLIAR